MKYTITKVNKDGSVDVTFDIDNKPQNISGLDVTDADVLKQQLSDYGTAYEAGKALEVTTPDAAVLALIGKPQEAIVAIDPTSEAAPVA